MSENFPTQRRRRILDRVRANGAVKVAQLAEEFGVSHMTVRRDLDRLVKDGELHKVHGGALLQESASAEEPGFQRKSTLQLPQKAAIARAAAQMVEPGMAISLTSGTTTYEVARLLRAVPDLTIVTNSPRIADLLQDAPAAGQTVQLTGGLRTVSDALVGPLATAALRTLHVDRCFMGVHGFSVQDGITTPNMLEVEVNRLFLERCDSRVVVAVSSKWCLAGLYSSAPWHEIDTLVSDDGLDETAVEELRQHIENLKIEKVVES